MGTRATASGGARRARHADDGWSAAPSVSVQSPPHSWHVLRAVTTPATQLAVCAHSSEQYSSVTG